MEKKEKSAKEFVEGLIEEYGKGLVEGLIEEYRVEWEFEFMLSEFVDELFDTEKEKDDFFNESMDIVHADVSRLIGEIILKILK